MMIQDQADAVQSCEEFATFVRSLRQNLLEHSADWENANLPEFLEAMAAWVEDMQGYFTNKGTRMPAQPNWSIFAQILAAARQYE